MAKLEIRPLRHPRTPRALATAHDGPGGVGHQVVRQPRRPRLPRRGHRGVAALPPAPRGRQCPAPRHVPSGGRLHRPHLQRLRTARHRRPVPVGPGRSSGMRGRPGRRHGCSTWCRRRSSWSWGTRIRCSSSWRWSVSPCLASPTVAVGGRRLGMSAGTSRPLGCFLLVPALCEGLRGVRADRTGGSAVAPDSSPSLAPVAGLLAYLSWTSVEFGTLHQAADPPDRLGPPRRTHRSRGHALPRCHQSPQGAITSGPTSTCPGW